MKYNKYIYLSIGTLAILFLGCFIGFFIPRLLNSSKMNMPVIKQLLNGHYSLITTEHEPNGTFDQATPLIAGYETQGTFSPVGKTDIDIYSFTIDNPANVKITLKNLAKEYNLFIYDTDKHLIASSIRSGSYIESTSTLSLSTAGIYYIELLGKGNRNNNNYPYTINLDILPFVE